MEAVERLGGAGEGEAGGTGCKRLRAIYPQDSRRQDDVDESDAQPEHPALSCCRHAG